MNIPKMFT